jgi:cytochrome c oxidase subunit 2
MNATEPTATPLHGHSRRAQNIEAHLAAERRSRRIRGVVFGVIVVAVLGAGVYMASSVFVGQRGTTTVAAALPMRVSMAGFDPATIHAKPGETITLDWWNTDGAIHLTGGVHTLVSDTLGVRLALPAESRKTVTITAPTAVGDYDFWCDSCCGGKDNPGMHGTLRVEA